MELGKAIQNRHSVRKFSNKKPNWRTIIECIDSARYAPMAGNNYTLKFILVDNEEKIKKDVPGRTRTYDPMINSHVLYQLSYRDINQAKFFNYLKLFFKNS